MYIFSVKQIGPTCASSYLPYGHSRGGSGLTAAVKLSVMPQTDMTFSIMPVWGMSLNCNTYTCIQCISSTVFVWEIVPLVSLIKSISIFLTRYKEAMSSNPPLPSPMMLNCCLTHFKIGPLIKSMSHSSISVGWSLHSQFRCDRLEATSFVTFWPQAPSITPLNMPITCLKLWLTIKLDIKLCDFIQYPRFIFDGVHNTITILIIVK